MLAILCKFTATSTVQLAIWLRNAWTLARQFKFACIVVPARVFAGTMTHENSGLHEMGGQEIRDPLTALLPGTQNNQIASISFRLASLITEAGY